MVADQKYTSVCVSSLHLYGGVFFRKLSFEILMSLWSATSQFLCRPNMCLLIHYFFSWENSTIHKGFINFIYTGYPHIEVLLFLLMHRLLLVYNQYISIGGSPLLSEIWNNMGFLLFIPTIYLFIYGKCGKIAR